jgi:CheY-like chemotaxis protein
MANVANLGNPGRRRDIRTRCLEDAEPPVLMKMFESKEGQKLCNSDIALSLSRVVPNKYERQSLEALGIDFTLSTSTEDTLAQISHRKFDLVISDMGRPPDQRAGYTLLDEMRRRGDKTPYVIYAGSRFAQHVAEARRHGAIGCTNSPSELIEIVTEALAPAR